MEIFCIYFQDLWRIYFTFLMQSKIFNPWKTPRRRLQFSFWRKRVPLRHHYIKRLCMVFFFGWGWRGGRSLSPGYSFSLVLGFLLRRGVLVLTKKLKLWEHSSWTTYYGYLCFSGSICACEESLHLFGCIFNDYFQIHKIERNNHFMN